MENTTRIDLDQVKANVDLLAICGHDTEIKKVATTNGGEYAGPCPFCGGRDRFRVQPNARPFPLWMCRKCTDSRWDTIIGYVAMREHLDTRKDLHEIVKRITGNNFLQLQPQAKRDPEPEPAKIAPGEEWQKTAEKIVNNCIDRLWDEKSGRKALEYLRKRGIKDQTIDDFRLGYSPGIKIDDLWVPKGITIPAITAGEIWYIKIRLPAKPGEAKYTQVKGSRPAIYNGDWLRGSDIALFCEGEFDCMIAHQELNQYLPCATLGSATTTPDLVIWYSYITPLKKILACHDNDDQGEKGFQRLQELAGSRVHRYHVPGVKDINDLYLSGSDLFDWLKPGIKEYIEGSIK